MSTTTDLSVLSAEQLAEKVLPYVVPKRKIPDYNPGYHALAELVRRASERDQAMRERDEWFQTGKDMGRRRADRLAAALGWYLRQHDAADRDRCVCSYCNAARDALAAE